MTAFPFGRNEDGSPVRPVRRRINRGRVKVESLAYVVGPPELHSERGGRPLFADIAIDHRNVASALVSISRSRRVGEVAAYKVTVCESHLGYADGVTLDEHRANLLAERDRRIPQFANLRTLLGRGDPLASEPPPPAHAGVPEQVERPPGAAPAMGGPCST